MRHIAPKDKKKLLLFGGSFDPPHFGHMFALQAAIKDINPDKVLIVPCRIQPIKGALVASPAHRIKMCTIMAREFENCHVSDYEIMKRGINYTIETLDDFRDAYPKYEIYFLMGDDEFLQIHKWKDYKRILSEYNLIISQRYGLTNEDKVKYKEYIKSVRFISNSYLNLASKDIRKLSSNEMFMSIPEKVREYIEKEGLYKK